MTAHRARKRFGQHFLHDPGIIQKIVETLNPKPGQHLVEIGPGLGALTTQVITKIPELYAIELDRDVIPLLEERIAALKEQTAILKKQPILCQEHIVAPQEQIGTCKEQTTTFKEYSAAFKKYSDAIGDLKIIQSDALRFDFSALPSPLRVFGNLPYNISTPLLFHLLKYADKIDDMLFMLQKEVVDRMVALPDTEHYGRLSIMVQYAFAAKRCFIVPPGAFSPPPRVYSAIIQLRPHQTLPHVAPNFEHFNNIVRLAFNQRRKTLRNSLKSIFKPSDWDNIRIRADARPETLGVAEFVELSSHTST